MRIPPFKTSVGAIGLALLAVASASALHAQSSGPIYWNTDNDNGTITIEGVGAVSSDQAGTLSTTFDPDSDIPDFFFSSDKVGTEAQTVGVDNSDGYELNTLNFLKGSISLTGTTAILLDDGLTVGANAGATSIALQGSANIDPGSIYQGSIYYGTSTWNNNSASDLTINANVGSFPSSQTLTLDGSGTGAIRILGSFAGKLDQESATSAVYLTGTNNSGLTSLTIDHGTVVATNLGSINNLAVPIENGGTLQFTSGVTFGDSVTITNGGTLAFYGDSLLNWGNGNSNIVTADTLTLSSGDDLDTTRGSQAITTLNLSGTGNSTLSTGYRLIVGIQGQGLGFLSGISTINVGNGYILDFGSNGTVASAMKFASGSALEARNNVGVTLTNALLPGSGSWTVGNDDTGSGDTFYLPAAQTLSGTLTINMLGGGVSTHLQGAISGSGGLTFAAPGNSGGGEGAVYPRRHQQLQRPYDPR